jgi:hypothetical protein
LENYLSRSTNATTVRVVQVYRDTLSAASSPSADHQELLSLDTAMVSPLPPLPPAWQGGQRREHEAAQAHTPRARRNAAIAAWKQQEEQRLAQLFYRP